MKREHAVIEPSQDKAPSLKASDRAVEPFSDARVAAGVGKPRHKIELRLAGSTARRLEF
jgi:hypothetical protein